MANSACAEISELFAEELQVNSSLACDWMGILARTEKLAADERASAIEAFLHDRGFETDAESTRAALQLGVDAELLPDTEALRFAIDLYSDSIMLKQWLEVIEASVRAESPTAIEAFLSDRGYLTHPKSVAGGLAAMTTDGLIQWAGSYQDTQFTNGKKTVKGYNLEISNGAAGPTVAINGRDLIGFDFDPQTNKMSWQQQAGNADSGKLIFSRIDFAATASAYVGPFFSGTVDLHASFNAIDGHVNYSGRISRGAKGPPVAVVAAVIAAVVASITAIVFIYKFAKWVGYIPDRWRRLKTFFSGRREEDDFLVRTLEKFKNQGGEINGLLDDLFMKEKRRILAEELLEYHRMSERERAAERGRDLFDTISKRVESVREDEERVRERRLEMQEIK